MTAPEINDLKRFDVAPFGFPNCPAGEVRFEETRDVEMVEVVFEGPAPETLKLQYLRKYWPHERIERLGDLDQERPSAFGWLGMDDLFTPEWVDAAVEVSRVGSAHAALHLPAAADARSPSFPTPSGMT